MVQNDVEGRTKNKLTLTFSGRRNKICFGIEVLRRLGKPEYVSIRTSDNDDSLAIFPCEEKGELVFRVPLKAFVDSHYCFCITSKSFVHDMMLANNMEIDRTYIVIGEYSEEENAVKFMLR